jgi:hypothetical protein
VLCRREVRPHLRTLLLGVAVPAGAVGWQILMGLQEPNFTQTVRLHEQHLYLNLPPVVLAHELLWRVAIVLQYVGISVLPAVPLLIGAALAYAGKSRRRATRLALLTTLIGLALCAILLTGSPVSGSDAPHRLWPALGLRWTLTEPLPAKLYRPLDLAGLAAAAAFGAVALVSTRKLRPIRRKSPETILLIATGACLLGLHLLYVQLNDTYIVPFIAFALLLLTAQCRGSSLTPRVAAATTAVSLTALVLVSLGIRANFAEQATMWTAAERLTNAGVPAARIGSEQTQWVEYHGGFDDWLAAGRPGYELGIARTGYDPFHDPLGAYLDVRSQHGAYRIQTSPICTPGWQLIARDSYRGFAFQQREIFTYQAIESTKTFPRRGCDS